MTQTATVLYSTSTVGPAYVAPTLASEWADEDDQMAWEWRYCFVCSRCTDHVGEHESLVAAGLAAYDGYDVVKTERWDAEKAREVSEAGYVAYCLGPEAYEAFCAGLEQGVQP